MPKPLPSPELLRKLLRYEPETGKLFWLPRQLNMFKRVGDFKAWNSRWANKEAFTRFAGSGYLVSEIGGATVYAHRVAWALFHGAWPKNEIDHKDGDRLNNRIANLRQSTRSQNNMNRGMSSRNKSGFKGVYWSAQKGKWAAKIKIDGKVKHLGFFDVPSDAGLAYRNASFAIHGEFARN